MIYVRAGIWVAAIMTVLMLCGAFGFTYSEREWRTILAGPIVHRGKTFDDVPQYLGPFHTRQDCEARVKTELLRPGTKIIKDCFDPYLPALSDFPPAPRIKP